MTYPDLADPQALNVQLSRFDDTYFRGGVGFRGPFYHENGFSLGIVIEGDLAALPYSVDVVRNTELTLRDSGFVFQGRRFFGSTEELSSEEVAHETGHAFFPILRGGFYGAYYFDDRFSITLGMLYQNTPAVPGVAFQAYECRYKSDLVNRIPDDVAAQCREDKGEDFPIVHHAYMGTLYGGVHATLEPMVLTLRVQSHRTLHGDDAYAPPVSGDAELSWRF
jgi:hypothetical protein